MLLDFFFSFFAEWMVLNVLFVTGFILGHALVGLFLLFIALMCHAARLVPDQVVAASRALLLFFNLFIKNVITGSIGLNLGSQVIKSAQDRD